MYSGLKSPIESVTGKAVTRWCERGGSLEAEFEISPGGSTQLSGHGGLLLHLLLLGGETAPPVAVSTCTPLSEVDLLLKLVELDKYIC